MEKPMFNSGIKYIDGDLIFHAKSGKFDVIGHCCNCFNKMNSGVAYGIKLIYPEAFTVDCRTVAGDRSKLGTITYTVNSEITVVNLYGQYSTGAYKHGGMDLDYDALRSALRLMRTKFTGKRFGFPMLGSERAGGNWDIIKQIISEEFPLEDVTVVVYNK